MFLRGTVSFGPPDDWRPWYDIMQDIPRNANFSSEALVPTTINDVDIIAPIKSPASQTSLLFALHVQLVFQPLPKDAGISLCRFHTKNPAVKKLPKAQKLVSIKQNKPV